MECVLFCQHFKNTTSEGGEASEVFEGGIVEWDLLVAEAAVFPAFMPVGAITIAAIATPITAVAGPVPRRQQRPADDDSGTDIDRCRHYVARSHIGIALLVAEAAWTDLNLHAERYLRPAHLRSG